MCHSVAFTRCREYGGIMLSGHDADDQEPNSQRRPAPPWCVPPSLEMGVIVPLQRVFARTANVVTVLSTARVFGTGCLFEVEIVSRRGTLAAEAWQGLRAAMMSSIASSLRPGEAGSALDDSLSFGARLPDGTTAITRDVPQQASAGAPPGTVLSWAPTASGTRGRGDVGVATLSLWMWPLPPAGTIRISARWPLAGIDSASIDLDAGPLIAAAQGSRLYWPPDPPS